MSKKKFEQYYTAGKNLGLFTLTATLVMTELNTSTLIGFSSLGYIYGLSAISLGLVFLFGLLFYAIVAAKKWKNFNATSVTEFFSKRYNAKYALFVAVCLWVAMLGFGANFIHSITICLNEVFPEYNKWLLSGVACLVMGLFTIKDGLKAIVKIDRISFVFCFLFFLYLFYSMYNMSFETLTTQNNPSVAIPKSFILSLTIITAFTYILSPWYGQKIFSAKSPRVAFYSVVLTSFIVGGLYAIAVFATAQYREVTLGINPDSALISLVTQLFPFYVQFMFYVLLFFIALTTIAALWNTMASVFFAHVSGVRSTKKSIIVVITIALLSYVIANGFIDQVLDKMLLFNIPIAALAFSLLYGFYGSKSNLVGAILSTVVGIISSLICYLLLDQETFVLYWAVLCIPLSFIFGYLPTFFININTK